MISIAQMKVKYHDIDTGIVMLSTLGAGLDFPMPDEVEGIMIGNSPATAFRPGDVQALSPDDIVACLVEKTGTAVKYPLYIIGFPPLRNSAGKYGASQIMAVPAKEGERYEFGQGGTFMAWLKRGLKLFTHPWTYFELSGANQTFTALFSRISLKTRAGWLKSRWIRPDSDSSGSGSTEVALEINEREQNPLNDDFDIENYADVVDNNTDEYVNKTMMRFKGKYSVIEQRSALNGTRTPDTLIKRVIGRKNEDEGPLEETIYEEKREGADHTVNIKWLDHDLGKLFSWKLDDKANVVIDNNYQLSISIEYDTHTDTILVNDAGIRLNDGRDNDILLSEDGITVEDKDSNKIIMADGEITVQSTGVLHLEGNGSPAIPTCGPTTLPNCPFTGAPHVSTSVDSST